MFGLRKQLYGSSFQFWCYVKPHANFEPLCQVHCSVIFAIGFLWVFLAKLSTPTHAWVVFVAELWRCCNLCLQRLSRNQTCSMFKTVTQWEFENEAIGWCLLQNWVILKLGVSHMHGPWNGPRICWHAGLWKLLQTSVINLRVGFLVFPLYFTVREFPFAVFLCYYSSWVQVYNAANVS